MEVIKRQIGEWIFSNQKNGWFEADGIKIYLRKSKRQLDGRLVPSIDIASIEVYQPGKGLGTRLIDWIHEHNPYHMTLIESILEDRFYNGLKKRGWLGYGSVIWLISRPENVYKLTSN